MSLPRLTYLDHSSLSTSICYALDLSSWLRQLLCNHCFLGGIIQTRDVNIMVGFWAIHLNSCKIFKNRDQMMVSKKRVEFVKDDVFNHIFTRTSSDWQKIENVWQSTNIARKADPRMVLNCQSFCCGVLPSCILFWGHISSFNETCLFIVSLLFWKHEIFILKKKLIELQHAKLRLVNPKKLKVFWLQKWLDAWKWDEVTKKIFSSHMNWTTHHVVKF
jgi:hypothetical protein